MGVDGKTTPLGAGQPFEAVAIGTSTLPSADRTALLAFQSEVASLQRTVLGAVEAAKHAQVRINHLKKALLETPAANPAWGDELRAQEARLAELRRELEGDRSIARRNEPVPPSVTDRMNAVVESQWLSTSATTATNREQLAIASAAFRPLLEALRQLSETDLRALEEKLDAAGAPWTPGRVPRWPGR
jgi:hypothetical protein